VLTYCAVRSRVQAYISSVCCVAWEISRRGNGSHLSLLGATA